MTNEPKKTTTKHKSISLIRAFPSYFLSLEVEKVLCFKNAQKLDLSDINGNPSKWTIILGNNGVGKTTLLRCLAGMEHRLLNNYEDYVPLLFDGNDSSSTWNELKVFKGSKIAAKISHGSFFLPVHNDKNSSVESSSLKVMLNSQVEVIVGLETTVSEGNMLNDFSCYGYGATRRMGETSLSDISSTENSASLFSDDATLINAEEWLLQTDYAVKSSDGEIRKQFQKRFNQIIEILKRILPEIEDIQIKPVDEENPQPRAEFLTPYGWVGLSSLGLGYRTMIAWMVDLAVRLFKRYSDSEDPLAEPAIVLVDEIDLHLHPKWQRTIMEFLTERFPNTQFIVTAHSPLVVQAAQDANIVLLRREGDRVVIDNNPEIIENWRVDQVLTSVFEMPSARPVKIEPWLERRKEILTQPNITESDRLELKELEEKIGALPTAQNPEDLKAMDIIRRAAKLLENTQEKITE